MQKIYSLSAFYPMDLQIICNILNTRLSRL